MPRKYTYSLPQCAQALRHRRHVAAIVANHLVLALVVRHGNGAVLALQGLSAGAAQYHRRIAAAVEQHHHLFFALEPVCDFAGKFARDNLLVAGLLELQPHVDDLDLRQRALLHAIRQLHQRIFIFPGVEIRFQRRCGGTQDHNGIRHFRAHHRDIARVITRSLFLLVGRIVLFIDDDQRKIGNRREHGGTRTYDHARFAALDAVPLLRALLVGKRRMQNRDFVAKNLMQISCNRGRKSNLRHEKNGRASGFEHCTHSRQINRRLARSGNTVQ